MIIKLKKTMIDQENINKIIKNQKERIEVARNNHFWFFNIYLNHYISYPFANFHHEMFKITEDESIKTALVMAFRGSAKSTVLTLSYPIWAILGKPGKKFVIILGETQRQAKQQLINIRMELSNNELLKEDLGPFKEIEDEWGSYSLVIPKYGARITAASMEQTIRGMKHGQYRPDLIICDDIEDLQSVKTKEGRDRIHQWISGEVIPAGDKNTKTIFVGNLLHEDSLLMRIKNKIENHEMEGKILFVPLIDDKLKIAWTGKYKNDKEIDFERKKIANETSWQREYLLKIISDEEKVIHPEWIQIYDKLPSSEDELLNNPDFRFCATGIDLAISKKDYSDYTAMVSAYVFGYNESFKIYILPDILNAKLDFPQTAEQIMIMIKSRLKYPEYKIFVESVGYQQAIIEHINTLIQAYNLTVEGYVPRSDKRERLALVSHAIQNGTILFPKNISPLLINQLVNFGKEKHDDLADAFSALCIKILEMDHNKYFFGFA